MNTLRYFSVFSAVLFCLVEGTAKYDRKCNTTSDCVTNAECRNSFCACNENYIPSWTSSKIECIEVASSFGAPCAEDIQCTVKFGAKAECQKTTLTSTGKCGCQKHSHFQDGICYESVRIGGHCKVSDNCISLSNVSTYCYESKCVCAPNYESNEDGTDCIKIKITGEIGSQCIGNDSCEANHSLCLGNICHCEQDHVASKDRKKCLIVADQLGSGCEEDTQCTALLPNTRCDQQVQGCQCVHTAREINNACWITAKLGESCIHDWECVVPSNIGVTCKNQTCKCSEGYHMNTPKTNCIRGTNSAQLLKYSSHLLIFSVILKILK